MPLPEIFADHPTPAQAYELGAQYAALLRAMYNHPKINYLEPPTAEISKIDPKNTHAGLFSVVDFVQNTYIQYVIPLLPAGATRKCKELANPWAYGHPNYNFELTWDSEAGDLKDASGNAAVNFPKLPGEVVQERMGDLFGRLFMTRKLIFENETDPKAKLLIGGEGLDFGEDVRAAAQNVLALSGQ